MSGIDEKPRSSIVNLKKIREAVQKWLIYYEEQIKLLFEPDPFYLAAKELTEYLLDEWD